MVSKVPDDGQIAVLIHRVKAEAQPETIGQREAVVGRVTRIDGAGLLGHIARHQMAAIGGDDQPGIIGPRLRTSFQQGPQCARIGRLFERQIVAQDQAAAAEHTQRVQELRQGANILPMDFDQHQAARQLLVRGGMERLDQR